MVLSYFRQNSRGNKGKTFNVIVMIQEKIQVKTHKHLISSYHCTSRTASKGHVKERSLDCWPRCI